jgi:hypothetical protein
MKRKTNGFFTLAQALMVACGFLMMTSAVYATEQAEQRREGRDVKQESKKQAHKEKVDCRQANNKNNAQCRQDKRDTKQEGRKEARDIKH